MQEEEKEIGENNKVKRRAKRRTERVKEKCDREKGGHRQT